MLLALVPVVFVIIALLLGFSHYFDKRFYRIYPRQGEYDIW